MANVLLRVIWLTYVATAAELFKCLGYVSLDKRSLNIVFYLVATDFIYFNTSRNQCTRLTIMVCFTQNSANVHSSYLAAD